MPRVSVVLPVFNGAETLRLSIDSVLAQDFRDLELVVVDDGSTDATSAVLSQFSHDHRVRVFRNPMNRGLVYSLNRGMRECRGELVARLDADDVAMPTRLGRQVEVFDRRPEVVLCATAYRRVGADRSGGVVGCPPATHASAAMMMLCGNRFAHSTVMFRRSAAEMVGAYRDSWFPVEDYDLWLRLMGVGEYAGLESVEVEYFLNPGGISSTSADGQARLAILRASRELGFTSAAEERGFVELMRGGLPSEARATMNHVLKKQAVVRRELHDRGIATCGACISGHRASLHLLRGLPRWRRHLLLLSLAPGRYIAGSAASFRPRGLRWQWLARRGPGSL